MRRTARGRVLAALVADGQIGGRPRCSPRPSSTAIARCSSSISPALRYWRMVAAPPPTRTSLPAAASVALQRRMDAVGHEVKRSSTLHRDRREHGASARTRARGRAGFAPPTFQLSSAGTRSARTCTAEDPSADVLEAARGELIVDIDSADFAPARRPAQRLLERPRADEPFVQRLASNAQRIG